ATIARVPLSAVQEQVFPCLQPKNGEGSEIATLDVQAEQDRILVLHLPELVRHCEAGHDGIAELGAALGPDAKVAMRLEGQDLVAAHCRVPAGAGMGSAAFMASK